MGKSESHKRAQRKAAGKNGQTEVPLRGGRILDARSAAKATEVERSGATRSLRAAAKRLKQSGASQKVLQVPQTDMSKAIDAMKAVDVHGSVKNMSGSKRRSV